ncbi:MAG: hypothetical protein JW720_01470 [Sedimentisphaerales bacterium]|nr:hypothetical protein [Sedimentisphaerales bacterium]
MNVGYLKERQTLASYVLLGVSIVLGVLTLAEIVGYFTSSARAQNIVRKAVAQDKSDPNRIRENVAAFSKITDSIKKRNLFVPEVKPQNPVKEVFGIMGSEALINGKWYKVGDSIGDAKIVAIEPTQVKVSWNGQERYFAPIASNSQGSSDRGGGRSGRGESRETRSESGEGSRPTMGFGPPPSFGEMSEEQRAEMRARFESMRDRFRNMSPEERDRFRGEMRDRFGGRGPGGSGGGMDGGRSSRGGRGGR